MERIPRAKLLDFGGPLSYLFIYLFTGGFGESTVMVNGLRWSKLPPKDSANLLDKFSNLFFHLHTLCKHISQFNGIAL